MNFRLQRFWIWEMDLNCMSQRRILLMDGKIHRRAD
jgi:hypothetical protein